MELIVNIEQLQRLIGLVEQNETKIKKDKKPSSFPKKDDNSEIISTKKTTPIVLKDDSYIIRKNNPSNVFIVMIGGTPSKSFGAKWMEKQLGNLLSDKNVLYSDWENTMDKNIKVIQSNFPGATISSVSGFSKGGLRVYPESGKYKFVGLIDPSIEGKNYPNVEISPTHNTIMIYKPNRGWGESSLKHAINKLGKNRVIPINIGHSEMPREFVTRFKSKL